MPRSRRSVGRARTLFTEQARCWKLPQGVTETAVLLLSELMTNAVVHAKVSQGREVWARCALRAEGTLRVEVLDADETPPTPRHASADDEGGRGLALIEALAERWGSEPREPGIGKTVWFELSVPGE
ncbi:ATP-binding protein [Streptomyces tsukubensis]|nr:ATP-binding protein [Streptomyces tsukubensis]